MYKAMSEQVIYVTKVPPNSCSLEVDVIYGDFGTVKFCRVKISQDHKSKETAIVVFEDPKSALRALEQMGEAENFKANPYQN